MGLIEDIGAVEDEAIEVITKLEEERAPLDRKLIDEVAALGERRAALVNGHARPEPDEVEGLAAADPEAAAAAAHSTKGVPYFWASVLRNCEAVGARVTRRDLIALEHLRDVRRVGGGAGGAGSRGVEFVFAPNNPFFSNARLRRVIGPGVDEGTAIDWKDGADLTVTRVEKKGGGGKKRKNKGAKPHGGGGGGGNKGADDDEPAARTHVRLKPCPSFFRFFEASGAAAAARRGGDAAARLDSLLAPEEGAGGGGGSGGGDDDDDDDDAEERAQMQLQRDNELLSVLLSDVVLRPTHLYLQGPMRHHQQQHGSDGDEEEEEDDDGYAVVAGSSGGVDDLPPATRAVVAALRHVQGRMDAAVARHREQTGEARAAGAAKVRALLARRRAMLAEAGPEGAPRCFWLRVLRRLDAAALAITPRDAALLRHLVDVRFEVAPARGGGAGGGGSQHQQLLEGTLELEFADSCAQLEPRARTLKKQYVLRSMGPAARHGAPSLRLVSAKVLQAAEWAHAPGGDGGGGGPLEPTRRRARDGRVRQAPSFFHLFRAGGGGGRLAFNLGGGGGGGGGGGNDRELQDEANAFEAELLEGLLAVLPQASRVYSSAPRVDDIAAPGDEGASEDEDDEEDGDDHDHHGRGGEAAAARRAALKHRHDREHAGGWRPGRGSVLIGLLLLVLVAQYLALFFELTSR